MFAPAALIIGLDAFSMANRDKIDKATVFLGFVAGYLLFAGFLVLYQLQSIGHFDSDDFLWRLLTPVSLKFQWTDLVCYVLLVLAMMGVHKLLPKSS